ncbi:MAG: serine hydrolase domain-containing protein, partial [Gemmatimonadaceae bacterium]
MRSSPLALFLIAIAACGGAAPVVTAPGPAPVPPPRPAIIAPVHLEPVAGLIDAAPASVGMDSLLNHRIDSIVTIALAEGAGSGAAVAIGRFGRLVHLRGYGAVSFAPGAPAVTPATLFDMASLTKVIATTTVAMILEEQGRLDLNRTVQSYLPEFNAADKSLITVRMLLTHSGGLEAYAPLYLKYRGRDAYIAQINTRPLKSPPGTAMVYSDWDMVLLQAVIERITGTTLDQFAAERVFRPIGMTDTRFLPDTSDATLRSRIAATAVDTARGGLLQGTVHDGNAWALGGVSGHAGLFSSARELATFSQFLLDGGTFDGAKLLVPATIARWTSRQTAAWSRALGWDTPAPNSSAGRYFSPRSFGHTGFTGTSIWIDPERGLFVVLLTNRVNSHGTATRHV